MTQIMATWSAIWPATLSVQWKYAEPIPTTNSRANMQSAPIPTYKVELNNVDVVEIIHKCKDFRL